MWVVPNFSLFLRWLWKESCRTLLHYPEVYQSPRGHEHSRALPTLWQRLENLVHGRTNTSPARQHKRGSEEPGQEYLLLHFSWWPTLGEHHEHWAKLFVRLSMALLHMWERTETRLRVQNHRRGTPGAWMDVLSVGFRHEWRDPIAAIRYLSRDPRFYAFQCAWRCKALPGDPRAPLGTPVVGRGVQPLCAVSSAQTPGEDVAFLALLCADPDTVRADVADDSRYSGGLLRMAGPPSFARASAARHLRLKNAITWSVEELEECGLLLPCQPCEQHREGDHSSTVPVIHAFGIDAESRHEHGVAADDDQVSATIVLSYRVREATRRFFNHESQRLASARNQPSILFEWPKSCRYWTRKEVQATLKWKAYSRPRPSSQPYVEVVYKLLPARLGWIPFAIS